ncbi:molybdate ABC transporter permease subunit [Paenibacillus sp. N1-5-1-14]|nr:molybdate ABC transporter permease subunit [Paenibacillus radicibacter]MCR8643749.1 molybdate ABC transporter permease subunit [Paenibacillus radicibacter]
MDWGSFLKPILLSLQIGGLSAVIVFVMGGFAAWWMSSKSFWGKTAVETCFMLPLVLPPTVVGFILLMLLGRKSTIGQAIEWVFNQPVVFTWWAGVIAAVVVAFPLVYQTMKNGFAAIDSSYMEAARSSGASEWQVLRWIMLPLASRSLLTALILGFARGLGEFGATLMLAGNIPGKTQTIPTAIYVAVETGQMQLAWAWCGCIIVISFLLLLFTRGSSSSTMR